MTFFLGCDVSKAKLDVALVDERGSEQWHDRIANEPIAIAAFLLTVAGALANDMVIGVVEATGTYHMPFADMCYQLGIACQAYNPIKTNQQLHATIRHKKTDRTDALMIARVGLMGEATAYVPDRYRAVKYYARGQQKLAETAASLKRYEAHLSRVMDDELPDTIHTTLTDIQTTLTKAKAQFAADTLTAAPASLSKQLRSIPGVGPYVAACLIGEIQTMERFTSAKALIAYAGLDPKVRQSGHSLNSLGKLSKRGSPHLRRAIFIAANVARQHDPNFRATYERKRAEGKRHTVAVCVVARQLLKVVRAVWLRGQPYWTVTVPANTNEEG